MTQFLSKKYFISNEYRLLGLMLFALLAALSLPEQNYIARSLLITHFGLFLLWQPVFKQEQRFNWKSLAVLVMFISLFIIWYNLWLTTFWMLILLSLLTGRIFARGLGRAAYGLAVIILFLYLTLIITPTLFELSSPALKVRTVITIGLFALAVPLLFTPNIEKQSTHVDFIRGFLIVVLTLFMCMGSVLVTNTSNEDYLYSLAYTFIIASIFLLAVGFLWSPRGNFSGIARLWEKYLLNIGGPFEQWITQLSKLEANITLKPDKFLDACIRNLLERHWITGIYIKTGESEELFGTQTKYHVTVFDNNLRITLYTHNPIGPSLLLHIKLLLNVLLFYYRARIHEEQLTRQAHLRAIYETGSKLTHDVKNILQSTQTLTELIQEKSYTDEEEKNELIKKQLPLLTQRLKSTLDKLKTPEDSTFHSGSLHSWWNRLKTRYIGRVITFEDNIEYDIEIPIDVFDSITENLLDNARTKRILSPDIEITVRLTSKQDFLCLIICDTGLHMPSEITEKLFKHVMLSDEGFGIGLYQSYQQAEQVGYQLSLIENREGKVCFKLKK